MVFFTLRYDFREIGFPTLLQTIFTLRYWQLLKLSKSIEKCTSNIIVLRNVSSYEGKNSGVNLTPTGANDFLCRVRVSEIGLGFLNRKVYEKTRHEVFFS